MQTGKTTGPLLRLGAALAAVAALIALALLLPARQPKVSERPTPARDVRRFASADLPLDRGLALVLFLSMDCSHCLETARLVGGFDAAAHNLGVYLVLLGRPDEVEPFFQTIGARLPYCLAAPQDYAPFVDDVPPTLYLLADGAVRAQWPGGRFNLELLKAELSRQR